MVEPEEVEALTLVQPDDPGLLRVQLQPKAAKDICGMVQCGTGVGLGGGTDDKVVAIPDQAEPAPQLLEGPVKAGEEDVGEQG